MHVTAYTSLQDANPFGVDKIKPPEVPLASYGTTPVLEKLKELAKQGTHRPQYMTYLINVDTLIRNCYKKGDSITTMEQHVLTDAEQLATYIGAYITGDKITTQARPLVCFYVPYYELIPKTYIKTPLPGNYQAHIEVREKLLKSLIRAHWTTIDQPFDMVFINAKGPWASPIVYQDLKSKFKDISLRRTLLLSHAYMDFHLVSVIPNMDLIESFTGKLKDKETFLKKVIPYEEVPFNKYTHLLFGDKLMLKSQIKRGDKPKVLKTAQFEQWNHLPALSVAESILNHHFSTKEIILNPKL